MAWLCLKTYTVNIWWSVLYELVAKREQETCEEKSSGMGDRSEEGEEKRVSLPQPKP